MLSVFQFLTQIQSKEQINFDFILKVCKCHRLFLGNQLLVGGNFISLWKLSSSGRLSPQLQETSKISPSFTIETKNNLEVPYKGIYWMESWNTSMKSPVIHLKFSSDGTMFASASMVHFDVKHIYFCFLYRMIA